MCYHDGRHDHDPHHGHDECCERCEHCGHCIRRCHVHGHERVYVVALPAHEHHGHDRDDGR